MKLRLFAVLLALPALIVGLLVAMSPAEAATKHYSYVSTKYVTMTSASSTGLAGKVSVKCHGTKTCRGKLYFEGSTNRKRSYTIKAGKTAKISVTMNKSSSQNPSNGTQKGRDNTYRAKPNVKLYVAETAPKKVTVNYNVTTETKADGRIWYDINGNFTGLENVRIELHKALRGGNTKYVTGRDLTSNSSSSFFKSSLGANNAPGTPYKLKLTAVESSSNRHLEWWWRGKSKTTTGGSRYIREANTVRSTKDGFEAPINFGTISGTADSGETVRALAPPASFSGGAKVLRDLDVPSCANVFGEDVASGGTYSIPFLPYSGSKNYMIQSKKDGVTALRGNNGSYGSCYAVMGYAKRTRTNLLALSSGSLPNIPANVKPALGDVKLTTRKSGFTPTTFDRWVVIREKIPGAAILDTPIVVQGGTSTDGKKTFKDLPHGQYTVEVGRRTACSTWYPSKYANNKAYFNGADRGAEAWKSFKTLSSLPGSSKSGLERVAISNGATYAKQGKKPKGYAGWMFRNYCKALGAGTVNSLTVNSGTENKTTTTNKKGAIVKGRVTRTGGRTNKEMLVTLSSTDGKRVLRTDYTDGSGTFYVAGLPAGNWKITVNADSWRGIGRTFTGKHSIRVKTGKVYSAGTLKFKG